MFASIRENVQGACVALSATVYGSASKVPVNARSTPRAAEPARAPQLQPTRRQVLGTAAASAALSAASACNPLENMQWKARETCVRHGDKQSTAVSEKYCL